MFSLPRFQPNPAGLNEVLVIHPGSLYFTYQPSPLFYRPGYAESDQTLMILGSQCFALNGDFRYEYEMALAHGGIEACVQLYLNWQPYHACRWTSAQDPWSLISNIQDYPRPAALTTQLQASYSHETALAA